MTYEGLGKIYDHMQTDLRELLEEFFESPTQRGRYDIAELKGALTAIACLRSMTEEDPETLLNYPVSEFHKRWCNWKGNLSSWKDLPAENVIE